MDLVIVLLLLAVGFFVYRSYLAGDRREALSAARRSPELAAATTVAEEDVTRFGEELQRLDDELLTSELDDAMRQDWQRALDSYEAAKAALAGVTRPEDVQHVTTALEDGRYAQACVLARSRNEPLPTRRPPCFFNPGHGPSTTDISWAPPGGQERQIPVCAADADRVAQGAEPDVRTVPQGLARVPYWQGGPAYAPYAQGWFGGFAASGLLPGFLLGSMMTGWDGESWAGGDHAADGGAETGGSDDWGGGDSGGDMGGGGDWGGDFGGFDF